MSAPRLLRPRALRPHLSTRYHALHRRHQSILTAAPTPSPTPPPPRPHFLSRHRARIAWAVLSLTLGLLAGSYATHTVAPPPMPLPGTHEDAVLIADLNKRIDEEFKVKVLRGKCLGVAAQLKGTSGGWVEIVPAPDDAKDSTGDDTSSLVKNLAGAKGLGVERVFWDRGAQKLVVVVWFGGALAGWPGVTHGGLLATVLAEKLALANFLAHGEGGASSAMAAAVPQRLPGTGNHAKMAAPRTTPAAPAEMSLDYVKPTYANNFYVVRVAPSFASDQNADEDAAAGTMAAKGVPPPVRGHDWDATLETADTRVCVSAKAKFASSGRAEGQAGVGTVGMGYEDLKRWLWPSRQEGVRAGTV